MHTKEYLKDLTDQRKHCYSLITSMETALVNQDFQKAKLSAAMFLSSIDELKQLTKPDYADPVILKFHFLKVSGDH